MAAASFVRTFRAADGSVNVVAPYGRGHLESRLVWREGRACVYLSSHSGCAMGCKFCFLTQQQQTAMKAADLAQYAAQATTILASHYVAQPRREPRLHYNFMARGEALANATVITRWAQLADALHGVAAPHGFTTVHLNVSTIMPTIVQAHNLTHAFAHRPPRLYYSLYSLDRAFRAHWLPNAMPVTDALDRLAHLQRANGQPVTFHWALIRDENDSLAQAHEIAALLRSYDFADARFSIVRYNAHPRSRSREATPERMRDVHDILSAAVRSSKIISRVGYEAYASCGMFPTDDAADD
jgi:adenine C2-methylase RlmN of 23S rRNA A2503 and tRNA A37